LWQLGLTAREERERMLGTVVIDAIDDNGYLTSDLPSLAESVDVPVADLERAVALIQTFEPVGVGARNLAECLLLQLRAMKLDRPPYSQILLHLEDLARRDYRKLSRILKLDEADLADVVDVIHSLNPKPGLVFSNDQATYVIPDVFVRRQGDLWIVEINPETVPKLRINRYYQAAASRVSSADDRRFLTDNARSAQWLIKSLDQRTRTILRVAESIFLVQKDFLEKGPEYLRPLILKDIADDIGVHESTISRVTSNKFVHTPRGIFEFKYFFSSSLSSPTGGDTHSAEAVKFKIRKLMEAESPRHPFSDEKLVQMLNEQGIDVARRTVAKYREALGIPPSSRRKRISAE
jgi:RNA polymerase sigma-54 factor